MIGPQEIRNLRVRCEEKIEKWGDKEADTITEVWYAAQAPCTAKKLIELLDALSEAEEYIEEKNEAICRAIHELED